MKKILLSLVVIGSFLLYSFHEQEESREAVTTVKNSSERESINTLITPTPVTGAAGDLSSGSFKDGTYVGSNEDVFYGFIQVKATVSNGRLADVEFLNYPNDRGTSIRINTEMMPILKQEAIQKQSADVDIVTGATDSSQGFKRSLANALAQAK